MAWRSQRGKWNWRDFLTEDEALYVKQADTERDQIEKTIKAWQKKFGLKRMQIVNRAVHRAKFASTSPGER